MATRNSQDPKAAAAAVLAEPRRVSADATFAARAAAVATQPPLHVTLDPAALPPTSDQALWIAIRNRTDAISFDRYAAFIHRLLCEDTDRGAPICHAPTSGGSDNEPDERGDRRAEQVGAPSIGARLRDLRERPSLYGVDAYRLLRTATQAFLLFEGGVAIAPPRNAETGAYPPGAQQTEMPDEAGRLGRPITFDEARDELTDYLQTRVGSVGGRSLPYLKRVVDALIDTGSRQEDLPFCEGLLRNRLHCPSMIELLWCFWIESGWLVQTMNAIALRFQNSRRGPNDPLVNLAADPLRPMGNLLWGFVQDRDRLSVARRSLDYSYTYGLTLEGKAVGSVQPVESRTGFIESFHTLLYRASEFFEADANTTMRPDGFPMLQALKEVHLVMAEGDNNQSAELRRTAREEMLIMQYLMARPEMREFLRGRAMVPYREAWMAQVDTMRRLQGGPDTSVTYFRDLADAGEKICLSVRLGDWMAVDDQTQALNWARYWRPQIQTYLHAYQVVTGVDLSAQMTDTRRSQDRYVQPSVHLRQRRSPPAAQVESGYVAAELTDDTERQARSRPPLLRLRRGE